MKHMLSQTHLSFLLLYLLLTSPIINAQIDSNVVKNNSDCPTKIKAWNNYEIDVSNDETFGECIDWLKAVYMQGKILSYMNQKQMQKILIARYDDIIKYYKDPDGGFDMGEVDDLRKELNKIKEKKPKEIKTKKKNDDGNKKKMEKDSLSKGL